MDRFLILLSKGKLEGSVDGSVDRKCKSTAFLVNLYFRLQM